MTEPATTRKRGRPPNEELRLRREEQILVAATSIFAERGYPNTDTQVLADALGVGKGTLYRYFPTKRDLFLAAVDRIMRLLHTWIEDHCQVVDDPLERASRAIEAYLQFFDQHPEYVELVMQERAEFKDRKTPTYFAHREKNLKPWQERFQGLIAAGRVRRMPAERITRTISNLVYGTMFTNYFTGRHGEYEAQAREILDIVFHGILSDSERPKHPLIP